MLFLMNSCNVTEMFLYPRCICHEAATYLKCCWKNAFFSRNFCNAACMLLMPRYFSCIRTTSQRCSSAHVTFAICYAAITKRKCFSSNASFHLIPPMWHGSYWTHVIFFSSVPCGKGILLSMLHMPCGWDVAKMLPKQCFFQSIPAMWHACCRSHLFLFYPFAVPIPV